MRHTLRWRGARRHWTYASEEANVQWIACPQDRRLSAKAEWRHDDGTRRQHRIPGRAIRMIQWPPSSDDGSDVAMTLAHYDSLATLPFEHGYVRRNDAAALLDELF